MTHLWRFPLFLPKLNFFLSYPSFHWIFIYSFPSFLSFYFFQKNYYMAIKPLFLYCYVWYKLFYPELLFNLKDCGWIALITCTKFVVVIHLVSSLDIAIGHLFQNLRMGRQGEERTCRVNYSLWWVPDYDSCAKAHSSQSVQSTLQAVIHFSSLSCCYSVQNPVIWEASSWGTLI